MAGRAPSPNVTKEGVVFKLAGFFVKTWESRYFRLRGRELLYYKNQADTQPRQKLSLRGARSFRAAEGKISARTSFCIEVQLVEPELKSYYFCVETEEYLDSWIEALNAASKYEINERCKLKGYEERILCSSFSSDGKRLLTGTSSGCLKIWDLHFYKLVTSIEAHRKDITECGFCDSGKRIFTVSLDKTMKLWDTDSFLIQMTLGFESGVVVCKYNSSDNELIAGTVAGVVKLWDASNFQSTGVLRGMKSTIHSIEICQDGTKFIIATADGTTLCCSSKGTVMGSIKNPYPPIQACLSPDGTLFASWDSDRNIIVSKWESAIEPMFEMKKHKGIITKCFFSPNSTKLVSCSEDCSILIWDVYHSGQLLTELEVNQTVRACEISGNQQLMLAAFGKTIQVWDFQSMELLETLHHQMEVFNAYFNPNYSGIVSFLEDGTIQVWTL